jgi:polyisoprenoid-binding protein YceI
MRSSFFCLLLVSSTLFSANCLAQNIEEGLFVIDPEHSSITFTGSQENNEFQGSFSDFYAVISLSSSQNNITATVKTGSVSSDNEDRDTLLVGEDWFNVNIWPEASFNSISVEQTEDGGYIANGELTIRDITQAVELAFSLTPSETSQYPRFIGDMNISRLDFSVGKGDWIDTRWVANPVSIHVDLQLVPAPPVAASPE